MSKRIIPAPPAVIPSAPELTPSQKATRDKLERRKRKAEPRTMTVHARVPDSPKTYKEICDAVKRDAPKLS